MSAAQKIRRESETREFEFTSGNFQVISDVIRKEAGINLSATKDSLAYSRLANRLRALKMSSFTEYCRLISGPGGADERLELLSALTTNVTRFFREPHHFEDLASVLLPGLVRRARSGGTIRIWSAGCSTGEEPYSLAMTILAAMPDAAKFDVRILATDIDPRVLNHAGAALFSDQSLSGLSDERKSKFFRRESDRWRVSKEVCELVTFGRLNLMEKLPMRGPFDAIFCRNVAIYFDRLVQQDLWTRFAEKLAEHGRLYIGQSERVTGPVETSLKPVGVTTYAFARTCEADV
ncbi:MAG: protein-glutamate O-methyltransferase CheR [Halocynthiibacter sp.]